MWKNVIFFFCLAGVAFGDLKVSTAGVKCAGQTCKVHDYCSAFDNQCYPCSSICDGRTHNFDAAVCTRDCQEYIHDLRYVRKGDGVTGSEDLRATVQRLQYTLTVTLTLLSLVILALLIYLTVQTYKWKKRNNITLSTLRQKLCFKKSSPSPKSATPIKAKQVGEKPDLRIDMPSPGTRAGDHSPVTVTTSISRRPAEDSALDYAYDNRGMASTPSPH